MPVSYFVSKSLQLATLLAYAIAIGCVGGKHFDDDTNDASLVAPARWLVWSGILLAAEVVIGYVTLGWYRVSATIHPVFEHLLVFYDWLHPHYHLFWAASGAVSLFRDNASSVVLENTMYLAVVYEMVVTYFKLYSLYHRQLQG